LVRLVCVDPCVCVRPVCCVSRRMRTPGVVDENAHRFKPDVAVDRRVVLRSKQTENCKHHRPHVAAAAAAKVERCPDRLWPGYRARRRRQWNQPATRQPSQLAGCTSAGRPGSYVCRRRRTLGGGGLRSKRLRRIWQTGGGARRAAARAEAAVEETAVASLGAAGRISGASALQQAASASRSSTASREAMARPRRWRLRRGGCEAT